MSPLREQEKKKFDLNKDGRVDTQELQQLAEMMEIDLREEKAATQQRMAWVAVVSMLVFTVGLFTPVVSVERVNALSDLLGLFYIAQAGVVGAYMGVTSWLSAQTSYSARSPYTMPNRRFVVLDDDPEEMTDPRMADPYK